MTAVARPWERRRAAAAPSPLNLDAARAHLQTLHDLAAGIDGRLVLAAYGEDAATGQKVPSHIATFLVGDVDSMMAEVERLASIDHLNLYTPLTLVRADLPKGKRGGEADIVAVLGLVADLDADTGKAGELPLPPSLLVETSPGNRQAFFLFDRPLSVTEAKPLAAALREATSADHGTADVSHVWRIPGTLNWPNAVKVARGRPVSPCLVRTFSDFDGSLISPAAMPQPRQAPAPQVTRERTRVTGAWPDGLLDLVASDAAGRDRSAEFFHAVGWAKDWGRSVEEIEALMRAHPEGIASKYLRPRDRLQAEVQRAWTKAEDKPSRDRPDHRPGPSASALAAATESTANLTEQERGPVSAPPTFPFILYRDIEAEPRKAWMIEGLLGAGELSVVFGAPGSGKSVLVGDAACHVATATDWFGRRVEPGVVIYVAAERAKLVERRFAAFRKHHQLDDAALAVVAGVFDLVSSRDDATRLVATAKAVAEQFKLPIVWIIIDTTAQVMGGGDENSGKDMSAFVANLARIQAGTGAHVTAVHHVPHFAPDRMRGHGALLDAVDTSMLVEKTTEGTRRASLKKANDGPDDTAVSFDLESVTLAIDETGSETTAPIVQPIEDNLLIPAVTKRERMPASQRIALNALRDAIGEHGEKSGSSHIPTGVLVIGEELWRQTAYAKRISPTDTQDSRKKTFARASAALIAAGRVGAWQGWVWPIERDNGAISAAALTRPDRGT